MKISDQKRIKDLVDRLARIQASEEWANDINPSQWAVLSYLARANRFSRSPSHVAEFMSTTRGTVSQTLKALARKGLVDEVRSQTDKRSISYSVTEVAEQILAKRGVIENAAASLNGETALTLLFGLEDLVRNALKDRDLKAFGLCETCIYHRKRGQNRYCELLKEPLHASEAKQICHEHSQAA